MLTGMFIYLHKYWEIDKKIKWDAFQKWFLLKSLKRKVVSLKMEMFFKYTTFKMAGRLV